MTVYLHPTLMTVVQNEKTQPRPDQAYEPSWQKRLIIWLLVYLVPQLPFAIWYFLERRAHRYQTGLWDIPIWYVGFPLALVGGIPLGYLIYPGHLAWTLLVRRKRHFRFAILILLILVTFNLWSCASFAQVGLSAHDTP